MHNSATQHYQPCILLADHYSEAIGYRIQRPHGLKDWMFTFTNAGDGRYLWGETTFIGHRGDIVVLPPGLPHDYGTWSDDKPWEYYWVHFIPSPEWLRWLLIPENFAEPYICHVSDSVSETRIVEAFERLLAYYRGGQHEQAQDSLAEIALLAVQQHAVSISAGSDARVGMVLEYLFQHVNERVTVPMLAEMVSMSPSRLAHLFKQQMGDSLIQMLSKLRLRHAVRLLKYTTLSIGEISAETGFQSQFYFSRSFKQTYGVSPKDYRKQLVPESI
jgi:AraC family transcriptional regulator of arabinose operon